ncbi:sugar ABC transporter permease [Microbacterium paludicola]|uniref:Sugar ABC transporter permease n=1 Tax=Microbacterium paludicola TaxID=300019 RepID=A0A4Y9FWM4_9MICO|nr:sugar ABC transporter permease [Microbacterium paludicola]MBF0815946.1 sugar ABC transporter permease [Microbacterium paludicola]TFU33417.1 sugar ABC transporter permease [Microbacterium paludicola]
MTALAEHTATVPGPTTPARRGGRHRAGSLVPGGMAWILPGLIVSVGLIYYSIVYAGYLSFFDWGGGRSLMVPAGFDNYVRAFTDPVFWIAIRNTVIFFVVVYVVQVVGGVLFAAAMHSKVWLANVYKVIVVVPVVVAPATLAPAHIQVWQTDGTINEILNAIGLGFVAQSWLGQSSTSLLVIVLLGCWGSVGFGFILYFAGMAQLDPEMLEAARIDGAGNLRALFSVVLPNLRPITVSLAILNFITALKLFDGVWLITQGGPANSSEFLGTMIYSQTASSTREVGYAAALSVILLVIAVATSIFMQVRGRERDARRTTQIATEPLAVESTRAIVQPHAARRRGGQGD